MAIAEGSGLECSGFETRPRKQPPLVSQGDVAVSCKPVLQGEGPEHGKAQHHEYAHTLTNYMRVVEYNRSRMPLYIYSNSYILQREGS